MAGRHAAQRTVSAGHGQSAQQPEALIRPTSAPEDQKTAAPKSRRRRMVRGLAAVVATTGLLTGGALTHFAVQPGRLAATDKSVMLMQRMGPPPDLTTAYQVLNADTAAIRVRSTGRLLAAGMFVEALNDPAKLPAVTSSLPNSMKRLMELAQAGTRYLVIFIAPQDDITSRNVTVDTGPLKLPGTVIRTDTTLGLAAIAVTMNESQRSGLVGPPPFADEPSGVTALPQLVLRRNPALFQRSAGFVLTSGEVRATGSWWCDTPVSGSGSGAPIGYVTSSGELTLIGLAVPSSTPDRCAILSAQTFGQFLAFATASPPTTTAYLGVVVESTATARSDAGYRGQQQGVYISSVEPATGAMKAGLRPGDVIVAIDASMVSSLTALHAAIGKLTPGRAYPVTFVREGVTHTVQVTFSRTDRSAGNG